MLIEAPLVFLEGLSDVGVERELVGFGQRHDAAPEVGRHRVGGVRTEGRHHPGTAEVRVLVDAEGRLELGFAVPAAGAGQVLQGRGHHGGQAHVTNARGQSHSAVVVLEHSGGAREQTLVRAESGESTHGRGAEPRLEAEEQILDHVAGKGASRGETPEPRHGQVRVTVDEGGRHQAIAEVDQRGVGRRLVGAVELAHVDDRGPHHRDLGRNHPPDCVCCSQHHAVSANHQAGFFRGTDRHRSMLRESADACPGLAVLVRNPCESGRSGSKMPLSSMPLDRIRLTLHKLGAASSLLGLAGACTGQMGEPGALPAGGQGGQGGHPAWVVAPAGQTGGVAEVPTSDAEPLPLPHLSPIPVATERFDPTGIDRPFLDPRVLEPSARDLARSRQ